MSRVNVQVRAKYCDGTWCNFQYFRCAKKALKITRQGSKVTTQCTLFGGSCIGYKCQYAVCEAHVMAPPDGRCYLISRIWSQRIGILLRRLSSLISRLGN